MAHLPRAKGQQPGVCAEEALPNFLDKLGQLGVHLAAVINLPRADEGKSKRNRTAQVLLKH